MGNKTAKGSLSTLSWGVEGAYGTAAANNSFKEMSYVNESLALTTNAVISQEIQPDRTVPNARGGNRMAGGSITTDFGIRRFAVWLQHLLGAPTIVAGGNVFAQGTVVTSTVNVPAAAAATYLRGDYVKTGGHIYLCITGGIEAGAPVLTHTDGTAETAAGTVWEYVDVDTTPIYRYVLTAGPLLPAGGITIEKGLIGGDTAMFNKFRGGRINQLQMTIPQDNLVQSAWDFLFIGGDPFTTAEYAQNPTEQNDSPIMGYEALLTIAGVENYDMKDGSFTFMNNMNANDYRLGSRDRKTVSEERRELKGQFTAYFTDPSMFAKFQAETKFDVIASFHRDGDFMSFEFPENKFFGDPLPKIGGAGTITSPFDITTFRESAAYDCQVVIKSTTANLFA